MGTAGNTAHREPWNKGKVAGQKAPFKLKDIWALRIRPQMEGRVGELALFNLASIASFVAVTSSRPACQLRQHSRAGNGH